MTGQEINPICHRYPLDTLLRQFETFVISLGDLPNNEWIGVEDIGASGAMFEVEFLSREHG